MKVVFIMVGKTTNKHIAQLMLEYEERIKHYLPFEIKVVDDLKDCKALSEKEQKQREGERIRRLLQAGDKIILLDERGQEFRSVDFASFFTTANQCRRPANGFHHRRALWLFRRDI